MGRINNNDENEPISVHINRAECEIDALNMNLESGERLGELLRKKVNLQRRLQHLKDEERTLRHEEMIKSLLNSRKVESTTSVQKGQRYKKFISGKLPKRKPREQGKVITGGGKDKDMNDVNNNNNNNNNNNTNTTCVDGNISRDSPPHFLEAKIGDLVQGINIENDVNYQSGDKGTISQDEINHSNNLSIPNIPMLAADALELEEQKSKTTDTIEALGVKYAQIVQMAQMRIPGSEEQAEAARRAREAKKKETERKHHISMQRFNLVEEMFSKAIERRIRATQRIAADPPADRLIGNCAVQHIPLAMLPGELQHTAQAIIEGTTFQEDDDDNNKKNNTEMCSSSEIARKNFFLTGVDSISAGKAFEISRDALKYHQDEEEKQKEDVEEENINNNNNNNNKNSNNNNNNNDSIEAELTRQWRELGYTAVYLPASRRLVYPGDKNSKSHSSSTSKSYNPTRWMNLEPLPSVHLIQRRLPMTEILQRDVVKSEENNRQLPSLHSGNK